MGSVLPQILPASASAATARTEAGLCPVSLPVFRTVQIARVAHRPSPGLRKTKGKTAGRRAGTPLWTLRFPASSSSTPELELLGEGARPRCRRLRSQHFRWTGSKPAAVDPGKGGEMALLAEDLLQGLSLPQTVAQEQNLRILL